MDTSILRKLSYGVYVISTWDNGRPTGCTANSVMQITSSPKITVALSLNHQNALRKREYLQFRYLQRIRLHH